MAAKSFTVQKFGLDHIEWQNGYINYISRTTGRLIEYTFDENKKDNTKAKMKYNFYNLGARYTRTKQGKYIINK